MVGYILAHGGSAFGLVVAPVLLVAWIVAILVRFALALRRRAGPRHSDWVHCTAAALIAAALFAPYAWWQTLFAGRIANGTSHRRA